MAVLIDLMNFTQIVLSKYSVHLDNDNRYIKVNTLSVQINTHLHLKEKICEQAKINPHSDQRFA